MPEMLEKILFIPLVMRLHDINTNVTGDSGMTAEMKTFYDKNLLVNAKPKLVHVQFGQKRPLPQGSGKIIAFRKYSPLTRALTPLTEGVTPNGKKLTVSEITATVEQYGDYVAVSDMLKTTAIDNNIVEATKLLGDQAGDTIDVICREIINAGTSVQFGDGSVASRKLLTAFDATRANNDYFTCEVIRRGMLTLRNNNGKPVEGGDYVCIIGPEMEYSLKKDSEWIDYHKSNPYTDKIFAGEIGKYDGCRFVVSTNAKIFAAPWLIASQKNLTVASLATKTFTVDEAITAAEATAMTGRKLWIKGYFYTVASAAAGAAGAATVTVSETVSGSPTDGEIIYPGDMGIGLTEMPDKGADVGSALFIASDAYGVTELEGMGLKTIIKQLGSAGTADALDQRATIGWKTTHVTKILSQLFMTRAECALEHIVGAN
jgi:N4-gp56 family major capsid protein